MTLFPRQIMPLNEVHLMINPNLARKGFAAKTKKVHLNLLNPVAVKGTERAAEVTNSDDNDDGKKDVNEKMHAFQLKDLGAGVYLITQLSDHISNQIIEGAGLVSSELKYRAGQFADIPHMASHSWWCLALLSLSLIFLPSLICCLEYAMPLHSVDLGLAGNFNFVWGNLVYNQILIMLPWAASFHYVIPEANIPIKVRCASILVGLGVVKFFDMFITMAWFAKDVQPVFPIPFWTVVSWSIGLPFSVVSLYYMTPERSKHQAKFRHCACILVAIAAVSLVCSCFYTALNHLEGSPWQPVLALTVGLFRMLCKNVVVASIGMNLTEKYMFFGFVVHMIFAFFQAIATPVITNYITVAALIFGTAAGFACRYYSLTDRLSLLWISMWHLIAYEDDSRAKTVRTSLKVQGEGNLHIGGGIFLATLSDVHSLGMTLEKPVFSITRLVDTIKRRSSRYLNGGDKKSSERKEAEKTCNLDITQASDEEGETRNNSPTHSPEQLEEGAPPVSQKSNLQATDVLAEMEEIDLVSTQKSEVQALSMSETAWFQRQMFNINDAVGCELFGMFAMIQTLLQIAISQRSQQSEHLIKQIDIMGKPVHHPGFFVWVTIMTNVLFITIFLTLALHRMEKFAGERKPTCNSVLTYILRNQFWFMFLWLVAAGAITSSASVPHFGFDFSMNFIWLQCRSPGYMAWPICK